MNQPQLRFGRLISDLCLPRRSLGEGGISDPRRIWRRTDLQSLEEQEPVLHTDEGPLGYRTDIAIPKDQAKALVNELL